jgi:ABC-type nitrate/sulfonate/bicarbonate transport system substrate-binding protein
MRISTGRRPFLGLFGGAATTALVGRRASAATAFNFQAAWVNDAEFMGYFIAIDEGFYAAEGLEVTYFPGGPDVIPESTLLGGRADLTLTTPDTTIKAITEQGAKFKIIGTQYQKNPIGIVSLAKNPINEPKDLIGKTLAVPPVNVISVEAMLKLNGIDRARVNIVPYAYDPTPLIKGEIDASLDFTTNVPYTIEQAGEKAHSFLLYDHGFTIYNDTVVVTEETLASRRGDLVAFLRASRKGWEESFKDPDGWPPRFERTWFKGTGRTIANEIFFNNAQRPLIEHPDGIFTMDEDGIAKNIDALGQIGIRASREMFDTTLLAEI